MVANVLLGRLWEAGKAVVVRKREKCWDSLGRWQEEIK